MYVTIYKMNKICLNQEARRVWFQGRTSVLVVCNCRYGPLSYLGNIGMRTGTTTVGVISSQSKRCEQIFIGIYHVDTFIYASLQEDIQTHRRTGLCVVVFDLSGSQSGRDMKAKQTRNFGVC